MAFQDGTATLAAESDLGGLGSELMTAGATLDIEAILSGDLLIPNYITDVRPLSSTRLRVDFIDSVKKNNALVDTRNYTITAAVGIAIPVIASVDVPDIADPTFIELIVSEMTNGASYALAINVDPPGTPVTGANGLPIPPDPFAFTGEGVAPQILLALAISATAAQVQFTEPIQATAVSSNPAYYTFDLGLSVLSVTNVAGNIVTLETSEQTEGELYTLTVNPTTGNILDSANNPMAKPATSPMLGYAPGIPVDLPLKLSMYRFILQSIRDEDQERGDQFLERFLEGPQSIWRVINDTILAIPSLWSVTDCPDAALQFLKDIVGWGGRYAIVTNSLGADILRRLIAASVPFWKERGPEDTIEDILRLTTGARVRILNWFWYRWIVGETQISEEWEGTDPWAIGGPGTGDEYTYNIRIVDDGTLDRELVRNLALITRPACERVDISYLRFVDFFTSVGDTSQWTDTVGTVGVAVEDGVLKLVDETSEERAIVSVEGAEDWSNYVVTWRVRGGGSAGQLILMFYQSGPNDYYQLIMDIPNVLVLQSVVAGTPTTLATYGSTGQFVDDVFYAIRVEVVPEGASTRIRVFIDASPRINYLDSDHAQGTIGVGHYSNSHIEVDGIEMFLNPMQSDFIDINTQV